MKKIIFAGWIISAVALFLYSFTQVDLSLTFSQASVWQGIQKAFQYVGYFNRPLSTLLYLLIIGLMFVLYIATLYFIKKKKLEQGNIWKIIVGVSVILFLSYNAFSYDLFNYIFDAKIVTYYHENPYEHKALDYPSDPMLSFMRWTHRTYPYGPFFLPLTIPLSYLGFGFFSVTFYLFKLLSVLSFIGSVYFIQRIAKKMNLDPAFSMAAFALNPLVLVESLVSSHNDIIMMFFGLLSLSMFLEKKYVKSVLGFILSIGIKYATALLAPAIIAKGLFKVGRETFFYILTLSMLIMVVFASLRTNFQPWYLLFALPFSAFIQNKYFVMIPVITVSFFAMLQYVPFLYVGDWNPPIPAVLQVLTYSSIVSSILLTVLYAFIRPQNRR
jgi:hypothetical protein